MDQDLVDRNVVIAFLNQMAGELVTEARKQSDLAAPPLEEIKAASAAAKALRAAIRAIERLPTYELEDRFEITEQGRHYVDEHPCCVEEARVAAGEED